MSADGVAVNRATVARQFHGFVAHDLDAIMDTFADDCAYDEYHGRDAHGRRFHGKAAIRRAFADIFARTPDCTFKDPVIVVEGDRAIAKWTFVLSTDGPRIEIDGIDLFELRAGKVVEKHSFLKARRLPLRVLVRAFVTSLMSRRARSWR